MPTLHQYRIRDLDNAVHQISVGKKDAGEACLVQVRAFCLLFTRYMHPRVS